MPHKLERIEMELAHAREGIANLKRDLAATRETLQEFRKGLEELKGKVRSAEAAAQRERVFRDRVSALANEAKQ